MFSRKPLIFVTQCLFFSLLFITSQIPVRISAVAVKKSAIKQTTKQVRAAKKQAKKAKRFVKKQLKQAKRSAKKQARKAKKLAKQEVKQKKRVPKKEKKGSKQPTKKSGKKTDRYLDEIREKINKSPKDADVKLFDLVGDFLSKLPIPKPALSIFNDKLAMRNISILKDLPSSPTIRSGLGFTGSLFLNKMAVKATMYVVLDTELRPQFMFILELPDTYKISSLFPQFKKLDVFSLPKPKYVLTSFEYTLADESLRKPGFYFNAELDLSGPLDFLRTLKDNAKKFDFIVVRDEPVEFWGSIPLNLGLGGASVSVSFGARIPIRFGIDFTKIKQIPSSVTNVFKEFTTDDFELNVTLFPTVSMTLEAGVRIVLGTQKDPLRFSNIAKIVPLSKQFAFGGRMRNKLELKWFALGDAGYQLEWDMKVLKPIWSAGIPLPVSGLGYYGEIDIGKEGKSRAAFKFSSAAKLTSNKFPALLGEIEAKNVKFDDLVAFLALMAKRTKRLKKPFPVDKIPTFEIKKLRGYFATESTTIAKKFYEAGFGFTLDAQLFDQKVVYDVNIEHKKLKMSGTGYLSNIVFDLKGKKVFSLTGPGLDQKYGTPDDGPIIYCDFDVLHPGAAKFGVRAKLDVPPLALKADTDLVFAGTSFKADIETKLAGFTADYQVVLNPLRMRDTAIHIGFKNDFENVLAKQLLATLNVLKNSAVSKLDAINKKVTDFSGKMASMGKKVVSALEQKAAALKRDIANVQSKINSLAAERDGTKKIRVAKRAAITAKIVIQEGILKSKQAALALVSKPLQAAAAKAAQVVGDITKKLAEAKLLQKTVQATIGNVSKIIDSMSKGAKPLKIKEASGGYGIKDMLEGKLPMITLVVETKFIGMPSKTLSLKNVQFDFKDAGKSIARIAKAILKGVGLRK